MYALNITILPFSVFSGVAPGCIRFICKHFYTGEIGNFAFQIWKMYTLKITNVSFVFCGVSPGCLRFNDQ